MPEISCITRDSNGNLPSFAWPGGYPMYYFAENTGQVFCPECANQSDAEPEITHYDINWENEDMYCDGCSIQIEPAYISD